MSTAQTSCTAELCPLLCLTAPPRRRAGPNGAGKTTTINCLTGVLPVTKGDAIMQGQQLTSPGGLWAIRRMMGICPQFDVLWGELTGMEHVQLFARIKGLSGRAVNKEAMDLLGKVG